MRGSIIKRGRSWGFVIDAGRDPKTGKRKQKWIGFKPTTSHSHNCTEEVCSKNCKLRQEADAKLAEILRKVEKGSWVDASRLTMVEYLRSWHAKNVVPHRRPETSRTYAAMIAHVAAAPIGMMPLQKVRTSDLEAFYASVKLAPSSVTVLHAVIRRALRIAVRDRLITANPAIEVEDRPRVSKDLSQGARVHCWSAVEARKFIEAAKSASPQVAAFMLLALDTGARKSELAGLKWTDLDFTAGTITIERQLDRAGAEPAFGVTKTGRARTIPLGAETLTRLRAHKQAQAALKLKNRTVYRDFGLMFAREPEDLHRPDLALGQPIETLSEGRFQALVKTAGVPRIRFHGVRHSCATLLLQAGTPVHVVSQRLGHASAVMTLSTYAHALPSMQSDAAARLGAILHG